MQCNNVLIENALFRLVVGEDCVAKSLILKATGEECLAAGEETKLFSVTQERPFNNEVKLAHPNKRTEFLANRVRREGNRLIVGFELAPYEAVIAIREEPTYVAFVLEDFLVHPKDYEGLKLSPPPVAEFRLIQLPVKNRENFGEWLNVSWDDTVAVNVLATSPHARIDSQRRKDSRILTADAVRDIKLKGCGAALIVCETARLLDAIAQVEEDYDLPRGVQSRRSDSINASIYWGSDINPTNVDEHIAFAKKCGFRMMLLYYSSICKSGAGYGLCGNYDYREEYPNGATDVREMLERIKAAGIIPGLHFLHTHIGLQSRYVSPVADHRLNLTRRFTLSEPIGAEDDVIFVEQNPDQVVMEQSCRVLKFDGELIQYHDYVAESPYRFTGCVRGFCNTRRTAHAMGTMGGILDISEFGATSAYLDQNSSLQDEVGEKLAGIYNAGFEFVYFDGSEGTNPPFEFHVPNAQYRIYKKFAKPPLLAEGAAKAHFSWHMLSGGNAFDVFPMEVFKQKIAEFPAEEAARMRKDFTRVNFGWWQFFPNAGSDLYEYGTSLAAGWDCPVTLCANPALFRSNPCAEDIFEVLRRWEDVRAQRWLTAEHKAALRQTDVEHTLLIDEQGNYELTPYKRIRKAAGGNSSLDAFSFQRNGESYVTFWSTAGSGKLHLPLKEKTVVLEREIGGSQIPFASNAGELVLPLGRKCYLHGKMPLSELENAFERAVVVEA